MKEILDKHWQEEALLAEPERLETLLEPYLISSQEREMRGQRGLSARYWKNGTMGRINSQPVSIVFVNLSVIGDLKS